MKFYLASIAAATLATLQSAAAERSWDVLTDTQLPKPVSDHSSTFIPADVTSNTKAGIYIAGGCDSPKGNTHVDADGLELDFFLCESISDQLHIFDADTMTFRTSEATLPRARYRHAAVHAQGKLWLVGGRAIPEDNVINEVDVYDPTTDSWTTVGKIPDRFSTSDNGAFANADGSAIYVVGGYNPFYFDPDALATTFSFETQAALDQQVWNVALGNTDLVEDLVVTQRAGLVQGRGDIHVVSSQDGEKAYVAGGYSGMCQPLTSAEVYDIETDEWSTAGNLLKARGDGAMVETSGTIFAIGGEVNHPDQCAAPELVPPLSVQSVAVNDVEAFEYAATLGTAAEWVDVADIPEFRFRFSAASWPSTGVAYAFGGQTSFDESCKCFPTTAEITAIDSGILLTGGASSDGGSASTPSSSSSAGGSGSDSTLGSNNVAGQGDSICEGDDCEEDDPSATTIIYTLEDDDAGEEDDPPATTIIYSLEDDDTGEEEDPPGTTIITSLEDDEMTFTVSTDEEKEKKDSHDEEIIELSAAPATARGTASVLVGLTALVVVAVFP